MDWPVYFKDRLIISNLKSSNAVATLWTPKEVVQKLVDEDNYALMGQLYTKKGINYILRNILANPFIDTFYLVGSDLMDSGEAFLKLMKDGVGEDRKVIGDDTAEIEEEISLEAIEEFRSNVTIEDLRGADNLPKLRNIIGAAPKKGCWADPQTFPDPPKPQVSTYPAEIDITKIRAPTVADAYLSVLKHIDMFGLESEATMQYVSDTSKKMKEMLNLSVVVTDEDCANWNLPDWLQYSKTDLENYLKGFFDFDKGTEDYTYGERLFNYSNEEIDKLREIYPWLKIGRFQKFFPHGGIDQVAVSIVRKLKSFKYDKGAIALLGNPYTDVFPQRPPKKIPCLFLIQCQVYQGKLTLTAYFRSNDMYSAWPLNTFALRKLQSDIASQLDVEMGSLITISNMAHIYEHDFAEMKKLIDKNYKGFCEWDPRGNAVVEIEGAEIVVRLISPEGNLELGEWRIDGKKPNAARLLSFELEKDLAISIIGNAVYMGRQLERAELAVKLNLPFQQDNPLDLSSLQTK